MVNMPAARLAKGGSRRSDKPQYRILCGRIINGRPSCGEELGHLTALETGQDFHEWYIAFAPGWKENSGIWQMGTYLRKRYERTVRRATDSLADSDSLAHASERLNSGAYAKNRRPEKTIEVHSDAHDAVGGLHTIRSHAGAASWLPAEAQCPKCRATNQIDADLALEAAERWRSRFD